MEVATEADLAVPVAWGCLRVTAAMAAVEVVQGSAGTEVARTVALLEVVTEAVEPAAAERGQAQLQR